MFVNNKKEMLKSSIFLVIMLSFVSSDKARFDNYTLYKIKPKGNYEIKLLHDLKNGEIKYDFWNEVTPIVDYVNIMTSPDTNSSLEGFLKTHGINYRVTIPNIQE